VDVATNFLSTQNSASPGRSVINFDVFLIRFCWANSLTKPRKNTRLREKERVPHGNAVWDLIKTNENFAPLRPIVAPCSQQSILQFLPNDK